MRTLFKKIKFIHFFIILFLSIVSLVLLWVNDRSDVAAVAFIFEFGLCLFMLYAAKFNATKDIVVKAVLVAKNQMNSGRYHTYYSMTFRIDGLYTDIFFADVPMSVYCSVELNSIGWLTYRNHGRTNFFIDFLCI